MLEIRHLQTLIALAETGSMAAAAKRIHVTQSALSHQLKAVETHYSCAFFERKSTPLRWTPAGERMVALAYDMHRAINEANRDLARIVEGKAGELRIAVECHSCFEWLMPAMDAFRKNWPEVELDLVSGFHPDPVGLLGENRADLVIVSRSKEDPALTFHPLFSYDMPALMANDHRLTKRKHLRAADFAKETLITYPIPDERLDLVRRILDPADVCPGRRTATLTEAILQLVASRRGIAALPAWAIQPFLDRNYVASRPITAKGLQCELYAATMSTTAQMAYMKEFIATMHAVCFRELKGISEFG